MKNIVIVGLGEIGTALKRVEKSVGNEVFVFEEKYIEPPTEGVIDVMHICIPYSKEFKDVVVNYINSYNPELVIIHSTTKPGTCDKISKLIEAPMVHSPIRGVHPNLYEGIIVFDKYVGGTKENAQAAMAHLKSINVTPVHLGDYKTTEMAKILSTTYYGANILFAKMVDGICRHYKYDYDLVYTKPNISYNKGYTKLGMEHVVRPVLHPPLGAGPIGGHCISQNFELLPNTRLKKIMKLINENDE